MSGTGPQYPQYPGEDDQSASRPTPPAWGSAPPPPGTPPPPPTGQPPAQPSSGDNQKAVWAMILGIVSVLCCGPFTGVPAIILAVQAKREVQESGGVQTGSGMATAGLVLGIIGSALAALGLLLLAVGLAAGS